MRKKEKGDILVFSVVNFYERIYLCIHCVGIMSTAMR